MGDYISHVSNFYRSYLKLLIACLPLLFLTFYNSMSQNGL